MLLTTVPLFDKNMAVQAYMFRCHQSNDSFSSTGGGMLTGASVSPALEALNLVGMDAFTLGKGIFIPVSGIMLLSDMDVQCGPPEKVIFTLDDVHESGASLVSGIARLREKGYRFAAKGWRSSLGSSEILHYCDFLLITQEKEDASPPVNVLADIKKRYADLKLIATHIHSNDTFQRISTSGYELFEGRFYKVAVTKGETKVAPIKANSIRLINTVQNEDFDFDEITSIVQRDPALTISLLRIVNAPQYGTRNKIKSIAHAVAILGQREVRKWVTTAVAQALGNDRPNEITRISLLRAKFAENLAPAFGMSHLAQSLFLMGLFSVLDVILEVEMTDALNMVLVSDTIHDALVNGRGLYYPVLEMITDYEAANWIAVSRHIIVHDINESELYTAYIDALIWYNNLISQEE